MSEDFIKMIGDAAVKHYPKYKILPSLAIAQAIKESGWGGSKLARECHNYFGMKWREGCGCDYKEYLTKEQRKDGSYYTIKAKFRKYGSAAEGIEGYYKFLSGYKRYHNLIGVTDAAKACDLIRQDGWATDLAYSGSLKSLILKYGLTAFDRKALGDKDIDAVAKEVIDGLWGTGDERKRKLKTAGYDYYAVQRRVNEMLR